MLENLLLSSRLQLSIARAGLISSPRHAVPTLLSILSIVTIFPLFILVGMLATAVAESPTVGTITIEIEDAFHDSQGWIYRRANAAKIATRQAVVRHELLLREGDLFRPFLLSESERRLRALPFLREVAITPQRRGNVVDLVIRVKDTWSLIPKLAVVSGGGANKRSIGIADSNVLGYGNLLQLSYLQDEGRDELNARWDQRGILGRPEHIYGEFLERSDGFYGAARIVEPFRSVLQESSWETGSENFDLAGRLFKHGSAEYVFHRRHSDADLLYFVGKPRGAARDERLEESAPPAALRVGGGYRYSQDIFRQADEDDYVALALDREAVSNDSALLPDDRIFSGPVLALRYMEDRYITRNYIDRFERSEDFNLGNDLRAELQWAGTPFGSSRDTLLAESSAGSGFLLSESAFIRGAVGGGTRVTGDGTENSALWAELRHFKTFEPSFWGRLYLGRHTIASSATIDTAGDLDRDVEYTLGAITGLRGYSDRSFTGNNRTVLSVEDRIHLWEDIAQFASVAAVFFGDLGASENSALLASWRNRLYSDVGTGLRIGFPRFAGAGLIKMDLAFPLRDGPEGSSVLEPRFVVSFTQSFGSRLRTDPGLPPFRGLPASSS